MCHGVDTRTDLHLLFVGSAWVTLCPLCQYVYWYCPLFCSTHGFISLVRKTNCSLRWSTAFTHLTTELDQHLYDKSVHKKTQYDKPHEGRIYYSPVVLDVAECI